MHRTILSAIMSLFFLPASGQRSVPQSIYDFKVDGLTGGTIDFAQFKGKKILIVNTASRCTYTPQYEQLEALSRKYKDKLVVIGFPSNNFFFEETGNNRQIGEFCKKNYGVTFPMAAKISVKGRKQAPIYTWLTNEKYNHFKSVSVKWNFQKYLIDENGKLVAIFYSNVKPDAIELIEAIEKK